MLDALGTFDALRTALFKYYDTPFALTDPAIQQERKELLDRAGGAWQHPWLEVRPDYDLTGRTLRESVSAAGAPSELVELAGRGLLHGVDELYKHQEEALRHGMTAGRNVVVTAGTGSGKTEAFLLPVLASLVAESASWRGTPAPQQQWWRDGGTEFVPQRGGESGHVPAVRTLLLYPMNALVDDQLVRLRKALDSDRVRAWLDAHRGGHRFYFGRYTGRTPVSGSPDNGRAVAQLRKELVATAQRSARAREGGDDDHRAFYVARTDGAEMRSRWDMMHAAPDILITNFSMLNIMLMRERERAFFDSTRAWLESNADARFTLVIDELHMYRGTAGTEVAFLVRNLLHRLGIAGRPDKLRVLASSASLDEHRDRPFLGEFFGADPDSFAVITGSQRQPETPSPVDLSTHAKSLADLANAAASSLPDPAAVHEAVRAALHQGGTPRARSALAVADELFPHADPTTRQQALRGALRLAPRAPGAPRLRSHLFFRNIPGMWACSDPACSASGHAPGSPETGRRVGKLHSSPQSRCTCGARVLELLYCQTCGDTFLGGFTAAGANGLDHYLLPDVRELEKLPDRAQLDRSADNYIVYWPRTIEINTDEKWHAEGISFAWHKGVYNPHSGHLTGTATGGTPTGWRFSIRATAKRPRSNSKGTATPAQLPPFATRCPNCGDDWETPRTADGPLKLTDPGRLRSPIRTMRTGFEKLSQVLTAELLSAMPEKDRKVLVFSDSRQDAAKLSAGLGLRHYQDLLRTLILDHLRPNGDAELFKAWVLRTDRSQEAREARNRVRNAFRLEADLLEDIWQGDADPEDVEREPQLWAQVAGAPTIGQAVAAAGPDLLRLGSNPAGPQPSVQRRWVKGDGYLRWPSLYDFKNAAARGGLGTAGQRMLEKIDEELTNHALQSLFSTAGRDVESLGLGWLTLHSDRDTIEAPRTSPLASARAGLRVLAQLRRFRGLRYGQAEAPKPLRLLAQRIANDQGGGDWRPVVEQMKEVWGAAVMEFLISPDHVQLRPPGPHAWTCSNCRRQHLQPGTGRCTRPSCGARLPEPTPVRDEDEDEHEDYYRWLVTTGHGRFRLHCAELSGQTDRSDAQARQARFQKIFLEDEVPTADEVDLLSVTTTMEAGVDIGSLSAVVMANMPPTRFNYQQRVGRAGRRADQVAVALTLCRGRSHDEHYFASPDLITNEPTPPPYLSTGRPEIFKRVLAAEVLRRAFAHCGAANPDFAPGVNVHGEFGAVGDWVLIAAAISQWVEDHQPAIDSVATALARATRLDLGAMDPCRWVADSLIPRVTAVAAEPHGHLDLSERLAEAGLLPMFGFPTRVRYLYTRRPLHNYPWPPAGVIDRDLALAASVFAPGSEIVKDGLVHTAVGIAGFRPGGQKPAAEPEPLGDERAVAVCRACSFVDDGLADPAACPACGAVAPDFTVVTLAQPLGFRATRGDDFDGTFSWSPRAMAARAHADFAKLRSTQECGPTVFAGPGRQFTVNDNAGQLFTLLPAADDWGGWVSRAANEAGTAPARAGAEARQLALGSIQTTDLFFLSPSVVVDGLALALEPLTGICGETESVQGRRAAWYSLAFAMRRAAAPFLDVAPSEFAAGIYTGTGGATAAFLADSLENGAGYSTHLAQPDVLPAFLKAAAAQQEGWAAPEHASSCSASCYGCLRDYGNMAYHALLDWRLARDLLTVLMGGQLDLARQLEREEQILEQFCHGFSGHLIKTVADVAAAQLDDGRVLVLRHPLETTAGNHATGRIQDAAHELSSAGSLVIADSFLADRDPGAVNAMGADSWASLY